MYNATVRESLPIGSSIVTLRASDLDYDANGKVTYLLESEGEENFFRIDANTGVISLRSALDREVRAQHILNVIASGEIRNKIQFVMIKRKEEKNEPQRVEKRRWERQRDSKKTRTKIMEFRWRYVCERVVRPSADTITVNQQSAERQSADSFINIFHIQSNLC